MDLTHTRLQHRPAPAGRRRRGSLDPASLEDPRPRPSDDPTVDLSISARHDAHSPLHGAARPAVSLPPSTLDLASMLEWLRLQTAAQTATTNEALRQMQEEALRQLQEDR